MTRAEAKKMLINFGIEEPTDQQITNYLDSVSEEVQKEKTRADGFKEKADKADELQKQLDEIEQQNMSELEKEKKRAEARRSTCSRTGSSPDYGKGNICFRRSRYGRRYLQRSN